MNRPLRLQFAAVDAFPGVASPGLDVIESRL
jgi:hypothetical protein